MELPLLNPVGTSVQSIGTQKEYLSLLNSLTTKLDTLIKREIPQRDETPILMELKGLYTDLQSKMRDEQSTQVLIKSVNDTMYNENKIVTILDKITKNQGEDRQLLVNQGFLDKPISNSAGPLRDMMGQDNMYAPAEMTKKLGEFLVALEKMEDELKGASKVPQLSERIDGLRSVLDKKSRHDVAIDRLNELLAETSSETGITQVFDKGTSVKEIHDTTKRIESLLAGMSKGTSDTTNAIVPKANAHGVTTVDPIRGVADVASSDMFASKDAFETPEHKKLTEIHDTLKQILDKEGQGVEATKEVSAKSGGGGGSMLFGAMGLGMSGLTTLGGAAAATMVASLAIQKAGEGLQKKVDSLTGQTNTKARNEQTADAMGEGAVNGAKAGAAAFGAAAITKVVVGAFKNGFVKTFGKMALKQGAKKMGVAALGGAAVGAVLGGGVSVFEQAIEGTQTGVGSDANAGAIDAALRKRGLTRDDYEDMSPADRKIINNEAFNSKFTKGVHAKSTQPLTGPSRSAIDNTYLAKTKHVENDQGVDANSGGYVGDYQMGVQALEEVGMLKPGSYAAMKNSKKNQTSFLNNPAVWNEGLTRDKFLQDKAAQKRAALRLRDINLRATKSQREENMITDGKGNYITQAQAARNLHITPSELAAASHLQGHTAIRKYLQARTDIYLGNNVEGNTRMIKGMNAGGVNIEKRMRTFSPQPSNNSEMHSTAFVDDKLNTAEWESIAAPNESEPATFATPEYQKSPGMDPGADEAGWSVGNGFGDESGVFRNKHKVVNILRAHMVDANGMTQNSSVRDQLQWEQGKHSVIRSTKGGTPAQLKIQEPLQIKKVPKNEPLQTKEKEKEKAPSISTVVNTYNSFSINNVNDTVAV